MATSWAGGSPAAGAASRAGVKADDEDPPAALGDAPDEAGLATKDGDAASSRGDPAPLGGLEEPPPIDRRWKTIPWEG